MFVQIFCPYLNWVMLPFVKLQEFLYFGYTDFIKNVLQIFISQSVVCLFILLIVFFNRRKFNLIMSNLPIYILLYGPFWANFSQRYKVVFRLFFVSVSWGVLHVDVQLFQRHLLKRQSFLRWIAFAYLSNLSLLVCQN